MNPDLIRRHEATRNTMNKYRKKDFSWQHAVTCIHLAAFHLRKMGHRTPVMPRFRSAFGALRALKAVGFQDLPALLDSIGTIRRVAPAMMMMGDLAVLQGGVIEGESEEDDGAAREMAGIGAIVVCAGPHKVFGWRGDFPKMVVLDVSFDDIQAAWRL